MRDDHDDVHDDDDDDDDDDEKYDVTLRISAAF